jgi:hypothetical protein
MKNNTTMTEQNIIDSLIQNKIYEGTILDRWIIQPIFWSEDQDGNIYYDIESIRDEFEQMISNLEEQNEESDFDWDNM